TIGNGETYIARNAFYGCTGLTSITIPNSVKSIGEYAFSGCTGLTSITIPNSVKSIGECAFDGCTGLTSVTIPDSVTEIPYGAFSGCTGLTSVTLPNGISTIDWYAFADCTSLTSITIPDSVTSIGSSAFSGCTGLTSINIPDSVTSIWGGAFSGCTGLTSITIPDSVTSIGYNAFSGCTGLTSVTIPDSVTSIGDDAFYNTAWYDNQPDGLVYAGKVAYNYKGTMPDNTEIILKDGTLGIAANAFENCTGLTSITIPDSVSSIDTYTFRGCTSLTSITIPDSVTNIGYSAFSNTAWYNNQPDGLVYMGNLAYEYKGEMPENTEIVLKDGTTGIVNRAFSRCTGLTSITIPDSVTSIGESAFSRCTGLTSITIPDSVTNIGYEAFGYYYENDKSGLEKNVNFTVNGYTGTAAEKYASDNGLKFVALDYTLQDNKTGISLDIKNNAELIVETLTDSESLDKANVALADKAEVLALYDITLLADGVAVQPDGTAKVRIPTDNANAKVYRIEEDGTATDMNAVYENGYLVFTTDHFSVYAVAEPITALLGDVNGDGELTIADAILAQKYISGIITLEGDALTAADVTKDGSVSIADAIILQKYISNIITEL
ncbi:MAG: leucine-rich repeat protein, partial [Acutalibacteraceae bacterium]